MQPYGHVIRSVNCSVVQLGYFLIARACIINYKNSVRGVLLRLFEARQCLHFAPSAAVEMFLVSGFYHPFDLICNLDIERHAFTTCECRLFTSTAFIYGSCAFCPLFVLMDVFDSKEEELLYP